VDRRDAIIDYLVYAKNYVAECEERYGLDRVEELLDSCHALMNYGVDRYKRPQKPSLSKEAALRREREAYLQSQVNDLWRTLPGKKPELAEEQKAASAGAAGEPAVLHRKERAAARAVGA
jgi:spore cortex formation protein SpoVR/YcgB (stage V sporulation)